MLAGVVTGKEVVSPRLAVVAAAEVPRRVLAFQLAMEETEVMVVLPC